MARHRIAVALLVAQPLATEVLDGLRRALGASERERIVPHVTLVSPKNLRDELLLIALDQVRQAAEAAAPLTLTLGPVTTFAPATPTVHLGVGGPDAEALAALRAAIVAEAPLARTDTHEFTPHVTLAQAVEPPERITAAVEAFAGFEVEATFDRVHVLRQGDDKIWKPFAESRLGGADVVGRGGIELAITVTGRPDPEAAALLAVDGAADGQGTPFAVTARHAGRVAGAAWGWSSGSVAIVADLAVAAAHRGQGIGRKVLDATEAEAVRRGCDVLLIAAPGGGAAAALLSGAGWQAAGDAVADGRRLWRRELRS